LSEYDDPCLDNDAGVYTFLDTEELARGWGGYALLYVGMVYGRPFRQRISEHAVSNGDEPWRWIHRNLQDVLTVKVATVIPEQGRNITESLVRDIENLLLFRLDPPGNVQGVETYTGRGLTVMNEGRFSPLTRRISVL
jgi:hypothetical protein